MKVSLIDCTGFGTENPADYAASLLIFTKSTRLNMEPGLLEDIKKWPENEKLTELQYMANTIPSSWEFCNYTFLIEGVTRAFTHQLVRTRTASFAQQTMRVLKMENWSYGTGPSIEAYGRRTAAYDEAMELAAETYKWLIDHGAATEDARGVLPTNIHTNIVMHINLRNLVDMMRKRASSRTQGEYRDVLLQIKERVVEIHPWSVMFLARTFDRAAAELEAEVNALNLPNEQKTNMIKLIDQMRQV